MEPVVSPDPLHRRSGPLTMECERSQLSATMRAEDRYRSRPGSARRPWRVDLRRQRSTLIGTTAAVCAALAVVGCGGGGSSSKGTSTTASNSSGGKQGGTITLVEST